MPSAARKRALAESQRAAGQASRYNNGIIVVQEASLLDLFVTLITGLIAEATVDAIYAAFCAVVKHENETQKMLNRIISEPFLSALDFLEDAASEFCDPQQQLADVEQARLNLVKASNLALPLPAARAAFYVGVCHHLRHRPAHELRWYERSFSMMSAIEATIRSADDPFSVPGNPIEDMFRLFGLPFKRIPETLGVASDREKLEQLLKYKNEIRSLIEARSGAHEG